MNKHTFWMIFGCGLPLLLHGFDTAAVIRMDIPWWQSVLGIIQTFILAWLVAAIYNAGSTGDTE